MPRSIQQLLMIVAGVIIAVIAATAIYSITHSSSQKAIDQSDVLRDQPKIYVLSPSSGERLTFKRAIIDGKEYYVAEMKVYSDRELKNDAIPIAISDIPISHIFIKETKPVDYSDGKYHYKYLYTLLIAVDKNTFERAKEHIKDNQIYVRYAGASNNALVFTKLAVDETSPPEVLSYKLSYPTIYIYMYWSGGEWHLDRIVMEPDSASQPTVKLVPSGDTSGATYPSSIGFEVPSGNDTYTGGTMDSNGYYTYTSTSYSGYNEGDTATVYVTDDSGSTYVAGSAPIEVIQTNDDGTRTATPVVSDDSKFFYIDGNSVLHYRIVNGDPSYKLDIEKTSDNETAFRWVAVKIDIYAGSSKSDAQSKVDSNNATYSLSTNVVAGRTSFETGSGYTEVTNSGNLVGYILDPNGYIQEKVDLSSFITSGQYYIVKVTFYVNGYLWNTSSDTKSDVPYQQMYGPYQLDVDLTSSGGSTSTSESSVQSTTTSGGANVNYLTFFVMDNIDTYDISNATNTNLTNIKFTEYEGVDDSNQYVGPTSSITHDFISEWFGVASGSGDYDLGLLIDATDTSNYDELYKQSDVTDTILEKGHTLAIKVEESQLTYGIYQLNVSDEFDRYLFSSYFLWDGVDILWLDVDKNIGNYYPDFPYKKDYSISYNGSDVLVGYQVLVYIIFTPDDLGQPYIENVSVSESAVGVDLNGDGDTSDTVMATLFGKEMYDSLMTNVSSKDGSISNEPAWKTKYVGIRFTYVQVGIGEMEIPFYVENVTQTANPISGHPTYIAKVWVRMPVLNPDTSDNNGGNLYWYGGPYDIDGTLQ